ncbi:hypothetical protein ACX02_14555 [Vibrio parahaemolyticus]|uniref:hypothetical protein n=1 Tax=Vibrio parahaemolyticus TaxID=670 RepID=UPI0006C6F850|nr:hypothetical protein [Vibrio parahaemolyticus]KON54025.1 hypothetical protein ACX02_14555 [Vibrio parahaemolyticus]MCR9838672.1 hypothetical protein [Vibrio parahaemolyticus]MCS0034418.1 hypothetical protein [Vibrio parahaemolyticus]
MFRKALHDEIRNIFKLTPIDWAGALHDGADNVYVEYLNVREQYFSESHIRFFGTVRLSLADMGRDKPVFGVLGSRFDKYKKRSSNNNSLASINTEASSDWMSIGVLSVSKDFYFACEIEFDKTREKIKHFKWIDYE